MTTKNDHYKQNEVICLSPNHFSHTNKVMRKHSILSYKASDNAGFEHGSHNWLLHARYVRGEHASCMELADNLQKEAEKKHKFAYYVKGLVLADAGRFQEALEKFHSCIRLQPQNTEAMKQVAKCLFRQGRYQLSMEAYLEAEKLTKHPDPVIYCALAQCASNLGDPSRGIEWAKSAVQAGGGEAASSLLAKMLVVKDDVGGALIAYDHALTSYACNADTLAAAGALWLRAGDPRRAFQLLGAALAQQPSQHEAALALAAMMLQHKDLDAALSRLKSALTAHPVCVAGHSDLGLALLAKKKLVASLTCLQRAVYAAPLSSKAAHNLGQAFLICRRPTSAFCRLAAAVALDPQQPYTVLLIGISLERLQDARADTAYERAKVLAPEDALISLNLAGRYARTGRLEEAVKEAHVTSEILKKSAKPDPHLLNALSILLSLLNEKGVDTAEVKSVKEVQNKLATETDDAAEIGEDEV